MTTEGDREPRGELAIRTLAMPADTNQAGDIFGGWLLSQMDIAGGITASKRAKGRVATVAVNAMKFHRPVYVGDVVCCYARIGQVGTTSMTVHIEAWVIRQQGTDRILVTEGDYTFVALTEDGRPRPVPGD